MSLNNDFTHLLLTRFNTAVGFSPSERRLQDDWLRARLIPFEQYCLPSVAGQRRASFKWLIFIDAESPAWFKQKIEGLEPLATPISVETSLTDELIARKVAETGLVCAPYLISTRLDSDDAIARDHLAAVQSAFTHQEREFLEFPFGLQSYRGHLYQAYWPSNPFLSLIEKVQRESEFTTAFCVRHDRVRETEKVRRILHAPSWLQILHSANILSGLRGIPRLESRFHPRFDVLWPERGESDSFLTRVKFSAEAYGAKARKTFSHITARAGREGRTS